MMITKLQSSVIALFLVISMMFTLIPSTKVFAQTTSSSGIPIDIIEIDENTIQCIEGDIVETIHLTKNDENISKVTITNEETKEIINLTFNKNKGTVYSSKTGKTVMFAEDVNNNQISTLAAGDIITKKYSSYTIKNAIGTASTIASIASYLMGALGSKHVITTTLKVLTERISVIGGVISLISKGSKSHGIAVKLKCSIRKTTKNGKVYSYETWSVSSVTTY